MVGGTLASLVVALVAVVYARSQAHEDQRAWVAIPRGILDGTPASEGTDFGVRFVLSNVGKTPALEVMTRARLRIAPCEPDEMWPDNRPGITPTPLFPGEEIFFDSDRAPISLRSAAEYRSGLTNVYVMGRVDYRDVFGSPHQTSVCFYRTYAMPAGLLWRCSKGNLAW
jgi:hypothetical protein